MHVHHNEDEWYYVLDGTVTFHVAAETYTGQPGSLVFLPRTIPHTFTIQTPTAGCCCSTRPAALSGCSSWLPAPLIKPLRRWPATT